MAYTCNNTVLGEQCVTGNWTSSEDSSWRFVTCAAYAVDSNSDGSATLYYRYYVQTYGTINSTLQEDYCGGGPWGTSMAGTYLGGSSGATNYYGTSCGAGEYDYVTTLSRDGADADETNYVGYVGGSGSVRQSTVTLHYPAPKSVKFDANGGSGAPATQTKYYGQILTLSSTTPTRTGYTFKGWGTSSTATTVSYNPGDRYVDDNAITLYAIWQINTWTVSYNNNGGSGTISNQTKTYGQALTLSSGSGFSKTGYTLKNWNTQSGGGGTTYSLGGSYTGNAALTLYAIWQINTWTVSYNSSTSDSVSNMPSSQTKTYNQTLTLSSNIPTRTGYDFQGWATSSSGSVAYAAGASYTSNAAITLYAVWQIKTYTVSYNANGGSGAPSSQTKTYGQTLTLSSTKPTRTNYNFLGWSTSSTGSVVYQPGGSYTANAAVTLYAIWELAASKVTIYSSSGAKQTGLVYIYDSSGNRHYGIITCYGPDGVAHSVV